MKISDDRTSMIVVRRLTSILTIATMFTFAAAASNAVDVRGPKQKPQTLILEFDKDNAATKPADAKPNAATTPARPAKPNVFSFGRPSTKPADAASDDGNPGAASTRPVETKREISKTTAALVVSSAAVAGVLVAILRKRRDPSP